MNNTRNTLLNKTLGIDCNNLSLELATGVGKTKICLDYLTEKGLTDSSILVVEPRLVLIENFKQEIAKWNFKFTNLEFTTYNSIEKHLVNKDIIIYDEAHHFTERCAKIVSKCPMPKRVITLSATLKPSVKERLIYCYGKFETIKFNLKSAIDEEILIKPKIILVPLKLDTTNKNLLFPFKENKKVSSYFIVENFSTAWNSRNTDRNIYVKCSEIEYYNQLQKKFDWAKTHNKEFLLKRMGLELLNWCSKTKERYIQYILNELKDKRVLTFCYSINQTKLFGVDINSKNKSSQENLESFNDGKINHISGVDMLNEGINVKNCDIGIFAKINRSHIMQIQKMGRILRSQNPVIIIPYFIGTREHTIVNEMIENHGLDNTITTNINNIKSILS